MIPCVIESIPIISDWNSGYSEELWEKQLEISTEKILLEHWSWRDKQRIQPQSRQWQHNQRILHKREEIWQSDWCRHRISSRRLVYDWVLGRMRSWRLMSRNESTLMFVKEWIVWHASAVHALLFVRACLNSRKSPHANCQLPKIMYC